MPSRVGGGAEDAEEEEDTHHDHGSGEGEANPLEKGEGSGGEAVQGEHLQRDVDGEGGDKLGEEGRPPHVREGAEGGEGPAGGEGVWREVEVGEVGWT